MKVLYFGLNGRAGTLHYCGALSSAMARQKGTVVHVLLPSYSDKAFFSSKVKLYTYPAPPSVLKTLLLSLNVWQHARFLSYARKLDPDVVHVLDIHPWYVPYLLFYHPRRLVVTINDPELHSGETGAVRMLLIRAITRFLRKRADEIIVHGERQRHVVERQGVLPEKISTHFIGSYNFGKPSRTVKEERNTILFFGRIRAYKGLDTLLKALLLVRNKVPSARLIIAGEGDMKPYLPLPEGVELHNRYVSESEIATFLQRCSVVAMPYKDATQSGIVCVAWNAGKPVVSTAVGSIPEVIEDGKSGLLVPPRDPNALADALTRVLTDNKLQKRLAKGGQQRMRAVMDWNKIAAFVRTVYTKGGNGKQRRGAQSRKRV